MTTSVQYREYMAECLRAAAKAKSAEERASLLQLAQTWHRAATRLEASASWAEETRQGLERASRPAEQET
jgi:hypothetical protein